MEAGLLPQPQDAKRAAQPAHGPEGSAFEHGVLDQEFDMSVA